METQQAWKMLLQSQTNIQTLPLNLLIRHRMTSHPPPHTHTHTHTHCISVLQPVNIRQQFRTYHHVQELDWEASDSSIRRDALCLQHRRSYQQWIAVHLRGWGIWWVAGRCHIGGHVAWPELLSKTWHCYGFWWLIGLKNCRQIRSLTVWVTEITIQHIFTFSRYQNAPKILWIESKFEEKNLIHHLIRYRRTLYSIFQGK